MPSDHNVLHEIEALLLRHRTRAFIDQRITRYEITLFKNEHVTIKCNGVLNPATLLPNLLTYGESLHDCTSLVSIADKTL